MEQLCHAYVLAKEDCILYVHVRNIKLYFYLKIGIFGSVGPMKQLIKLKWPKIFLKV